MTAHLLLYIYINYLPDHHELQNLLTLSIGLFPCILSRLHHSQSSSKDPNIYDSALHAYMLYSSNATDKSHRMLFLIERSYFELVMTFLCFPILSVSSTFDIYHMFDKMLCNLPILAESMLQGRVTISRASLL